MEHGFSIRVPRSSLADCKSALLSPLFLPFVAFVPKSSANISPLSNGDGKYHTTASKILCTPLFRSELPQNTEIGRASCRERVSVRV
jgi:hypothetical protein